MNKIITLTSTVKQSDNTDLKVRIFVDSIGQYWTMDNKFTRIKFKSGYCYDYEESVEEIDKKIMGD